MTTTHQPLFSDAYLRAILDKEFRAFKGSELEAELIERLHKWSRKVFQKETTAEIAFINVFFEQTWGYTQSGKTAAGAGYTCHPKFAIAGAGAGGGSGEADVALGYFECPHVPPVPQVVCEFKDVRSNLDAPQKRKGNNRSPVKQCADYLREAMRPFFGNEAILPTWGLVTDMNEFRLYWRNTMPSQYQRFIINKATIDEGVSLLEATEIGSWERFLFLHLLSADRLLARAGTAELVKHLWDQRYREKDIENTFYKEYRAYRERLVRVLIDRNPNFTGTKGRLVRLAQKLIDRCIFVMFCEDMGERLSFPPNALRDYLGELSKSVFYEPDEQDAWNKLKELFRAMDRGSRIGARLLNRFNGGLFAPDPELEGLTIPNEVFCTKLQGDTDATLKAAPVTLLYFAGSYNFGAGGHLDKAVTLYSLGRIFEQSITELEALEAAAEERPSLTVISKRKRDGVYYTPEWVVERIVAETLGPRLDEIRDEVGWSIDLEGDDREVDRQLKLPPSRRSAIFNRHVAAVEKFRQRLERFTVLDPACGSGAFLIHTLEYLLKERRRAAGELFRVTAGAGGGIFTFKPEDEVRQILAANIYGVDINPASVEIASLALWLHTAKSDQPLCNLDGNLVAGNSLVGPELYEFKKDLLSAAEEKKETINAFDYTRAFPTIFDTDRPGGPGFDCIIGNPPYVKLQNFRKVYPETADFLRNARATADEPRYRSCQTGNFDLFLPFIERALELLNSHGRLGFIAPSLWRYNEYGEGLRKLLHKGGHLDRWIDFGSFQVFDEAIVYTALQFFSRKRHDRIRFALAPTGELTRTPDWDDPEWFVTYKELPADDTWVLVPRAERTLLHKLTKTCTRLDDASVTRAIFVGIQTSADTIYHLDRIGTNRYRFQPPKSEGARERAPAEVVTIEDAIMHPLVSGPEANRYQVPITSTYILFPYEVADGEVRLLTPAELQKSFPNAWKHLQRSEETLRAREAGSFDDDEWYRFGRHQNIDKQEDRKLIVAQTVNRMSVCPDDKGAFYLNNVRVNGILPREGKDFWFLLGILNCRVTDWVFRRIAKPKEGGYFEANRQFIAPLPIPNATDEQRQRLGDLARQLTALHTRRRDATFDLEKRLAACSVVEKAEEWLWPSGVQELAVLRARTPRQLAARQRTAWARNERNKQIQIVTEALSDKLRVGARLVPDFKDGELRLLDEGALVLDSIFVDAAEASQILINWKHYLRSTPITESTTANEIAKGLRTVRLTTNHAIVTQLAMLDEELSKLDIDIRKIEIELNQTSYSLYNLAPSEIEMVEGGVPL